MFMSSSWSCVSEAYLFTGHRPLIYFRYRDADTGLTLVTVPDAEHHIEAVEPHLPVPPPDGRWEPAATVAVKAGRAKYSFQKPAFSEPEASEPEASGSESSDESSSDVLTESISSADSEQGQ